MELLIKKVGNSRDEAEEYINAYLRLFNEPENLKFLSYTGIPFTRAAVETWFFEANAANVEYHTAVQNGDAICAIMVTAAKPFEGFEILALVVDAECRHKGIGGMMLETAECRAHDSGFRSLSVMTFADNKSMLTLLIKKGFCPYKIESRRRWDGCDVVWLSKYL